MTLDPGPQVGITNEVRLGTSTILLIAMERSHKEATGKQTFRRLIVGSQKLSCNPSSFYEDYAIPIKPQGFHVSG